MPLVFSTGFEFGIIPPELAESAGSAAPSGDAVVATNPRTGGYCRELTFGSNDTHSVVEQVVGTPTAATPLNGGCGIRFDDVSVLDRWVVTGFGKDPGVGSDGYVGLGVTPAGAVEIRSSTSMSNLPVGTLLASSSSGLIQNDTWYDFELEAVFDNTVGTAKAWVNGILVVDFTGDTYGGSGTIPDETKWGFSFDVQSSVSLTAAYDDVWFGYGLTAPFGPLEHEFCPVDSSIESDGTGSDADQIDNYLMVDDPTDTATYVDLAAAADREVYGLTNRTNTGDIVAVTVWGHLSDPDEATILAHPLIVSGATEADGADQVLAVSPVFGILQGPLLTDPDTATDWTTSGFNALTVGAEVTSVG